MKYLLTFIAGLIGLSAMAQVPPPFVRNEFDTNGNVAARQVATNIVGGVLQRGSNVVAGTISADGPLSLTTDQTINFGSGGSKATLKYDQNDDTIYLRNITSGKSIFLSDRLYDGNSNPFLTGTVASVTSGFIPIQSGAANNLASTNAYLLGTNVFIGPNTNFALVSSNSSTTGQGMLYLFRLTNGTTLVYPPIQTWNGTNGNVGIGTATPSFPLDVNGVARLNTNGYFTGSGLVFSNGASADQNFLSQNGTVFARSAYSATKFYSPLGIESAVNYTLNNDTFLERLSAGNFRIGTASGNQAGSVSMSNLFAIGNIGIGTTAPTAKLDITAATATATIATHQTNAPVSFATSGYTNTTGGNVFVSIIGTALTVTKFETNGTSLFGYGTITGTLPAIPLKPFQFITTTGTLSSNNVEPW